MRQNISASHDLVPLLDRTDNVSSTSAGYELQLLRLHVVNNDAFLRWGDALLVVTGDDQVGTLLVFVVVVSGAAHFVVLVEVTLSPE